ncbi:portal protein [Klebsiella phage Kpn74]|uniref:Portal protein n=1 Tax=Klebsiella phage Kpn74 TaxID=3044026 RepID=A0AAT9V4K2_9CAUD|nr:portal protein [Klebsiella phage Kpn74]
MLLIACWRNGPSAIPVFTICSLWHCCRRA